MHYEIIGRGKASKYFQIDRDLGVLTVRDNLKKERDAEYVVIILFFMSTHMCRTGEGLFASPLRKLEKF